MFFNLLAEMPMAGELHAFWRQLSDYTLFIAALLAWCEVLTSVCATFSKRMLPLRMLAILNNMFGVTFGAVSGSAPTVIKHFICLPLNAARMKEMKRLVSNVRRASETDLNVEWLKPFMHPKTIKTGRKLFSKGDEANEAFILTDGAIELPELGIVLPPGTLFGEMGLFTGERKRTASAICLTEAHLLAITYEQLEQLYFQNPEFGLYLTRLMVRRFLINQRRADAGTSSEPKTPSQNAPSNPRDAAGRQYAERVRPGIGAKRPRKKQSLMRKSAQNHNRAGACGPERLARADFGDKRQSRFFRRQARPGF